VPLFIGFVRAGVPLGATFSYLVAAPMINEVALVLLWAMFGWRIALLCAGTGVAPPIVQTLLAKGVALGTALAFMMAVTGLSFPETILLRRVLKPRLILVFLGVVTLGILCVGYLFNALV